MQCASFLCCRAVLCFSVFPKTGRRNAHSLPFVRTQNSLWNFAQKSRGPHAHFHRWMRWQKRFWSLVFWETMQFCCHRNSTHHTLTVPSKQLRTPSVYLDVRLKECLQAHSEIPREASKRAASFLSLKFILVWARWRKFLMTQELVIQYTHATTQIQVFLHRVNIFSKLNIFCETASICFNRHLKINTNAGRILKWRGLGRQEEKPTGDQRMCSFRDSQKTSKIRSKASDTAKKFRLIIEVI